MIWETTDITRDNGEPAAASAPVIVSASRATDIPAFYADWFFGRLRAGYSAWINPFNGKRTYVSYCKTRLIVFWSKNPEPLLDCLPQLEERHIHSYVQFTLNDYEREGLEPGVPALSRRMDVFRRLADRLGNGWVIWRFDPLILSDRTGVTDLLEKISAIGDRLKGYTEKLVFSFADIAAYRGVKARLSGTCGGWREFDEAEMRLFASELAALNRSWGFELSTCGERIDLSPFGIGRNRCIDDELMIRLFPQDETLMRFLGWPERYRSASASRPNPNRDKGQREWCGCIRSKDIGAYGTCRHGCLYCYAARRSGLPRHCGLRSEGYRPEALQDALPGRSIKAIM